MPEVDRIAAAQAGVVARRRRAAIKADVFEGRRSALDVFVVATIDPSSWEATIRVTDFLKALRGVGVNKIPRILEDLDISPKKRLGGLGKHQQKALRKWLIFIGGLWLVVDQKFSDGINIFLFFKVQAYKI